MRRKATVKGTSLKKTQFMLLRIPGPAIITGDEETVDNREIYEEELPAPVLECVGSVATCLDKARLLAGRFSVQVCEPESVKDLLHPVYAQPDETFWLIPAPGAVRL